MGSVIVAAMLGFYAWWLEPSGLFDPAKVAIVGKLESLGIDSPGSFLAAALFYCVCHSFLEEYYFRWFVYGRLQPLAGTTAAIVASSLAFMAHHVVVLGTYCGYGSPLTWFLSGCVAVGGFCGPDFIKGPERAVWLVDLTPAGGCRDFRDWLSSADHPPLNRIASAPHAADRPVSFRPGRPF